MDLASAERRRIAGLWAFNTKEQLIFAASGILTDLHISEFVQLLDSCGAASRM